MNVLRMVTVPLCWLRSGRNVDRAPIIRRRSKGLCGFFGTPRGLGLATATISAADLLRSGIGQRRFPDSVTADVKSEAITVPLRLDQVLDLLASYLLIAQDAGAAAYGASFSCIDLIAAF